MRVLLLAAAAAAVFAASNGHRDAVTRSSAVYSSEAAAVSASFTVGLQQRVTGPLPPPPDLASVPDLSVDPRFRLAVGAIIRVNAQGGQLDEREMQAILELAGWEPELIPDAKAVAWCESRWSPWAAGDGGSSLGLFQLWSGWFTAFGVDPELWSNPVVNARVARLVLERRGRWGGGGGWSCAPSSGSGR